MEADYFDLAFTDDEGLQVCVHGTIIVNDLKMRSCGVVLCDHLSPWYQWAEAMSQSVLYHYLIG